MLKIIVTALLIAVVVVLALAFQKPDEFHVSRSIVMNVPAASVFEQVNDPRKANAWMPWLKADPNAKVIYEGPATGNGASSYWNGNKNIGEGRMTIIESRPNELVRTKLEFLKPFKAVNTGEFLLTQESGQTKMTWSIHGKNTLLSKVMSVFMSCDKMIGSQFEKGLADLKTMLEEA